MKDREDTLLLCLCSTVVLISAHFPQGVIVLREELLEREPVTP